MDEHILKIFNAYLIFTNEANNRLHESLEDYEKKVIDAFNYRDVCYFGTGVGRKRREASDLESSFEIYLEADNLEVFFTKVSSSKYIYYNMIFITLLFRSWLWHFKIMEEAKKSLTGRMTV